MDFTDFVEQHVPGKSEAGRLLGKLVDAVRDTGKPGTLTLVVKIEPDKAQPNTGLLISDEVAAKLPKHERPVRKAWFLPSGQVVDYDPDAPPFEGLAVDEAGKLVQLSDEEVQEGAAHFLQHTAGVVVLDPAKGDVTVLPDGTVTQDPDAEETWVDNDGNAVETVDGKPAFVVNDESDPSPVHMVGEGLESHLVDDGEEEEAPVGVDPNNPFALADTAPPARSAGLTDPPEKKARAPRKPRAAAAK